VCKYIIYKGREAMLCSTAVRFEQNSADYERLLDELALILAPPEAPPEAPPVEQPRRRFLITDAQS